MKVAQYEAQRVSLVYSVNVVKGGYPRKPSRGNHVTHVRVPSGGTVVATCFQGGDDEPSHLSDGLEVVFWSQAQFLADANADQPDL